MNSPSLEIKIPAAIAAVPLSISEKVVLAHIDKFPGCSNARLAELIGSSCRGAENLLRRLRRQGYIEQSGKGRARRHRLMFRVEHHILCGDGEAAASTIESHTSCVDQSGDCSKGEPRLGLPALKRELSLEEELDQTLGLIDELCLHDPFPDCISNLYNRILKRLIEEGPAGQTKDALVRELTMRRDAFVAIDFAHRLPDQYQSEAARLISRATAEQLAVFRHHVETGQLSGSTLSPLLALANDHPMS
jgi:hypothetical protein